MLIDSDASCFPISRKKVAREILMIIRLASLVQPEASSKMSSVHAIK